MINRSYLLYIVPALLSVGCVSAQLDEPNACDAQPISWQAPSIPTLPNNLPSCSGHSINVPPVTATTTIDFSDTITKVDDVASDLQVNINQLMVDNTSQFFSLVKSAEVEISSQNLPMAELASYTAPTDGTGSELNIQLQMSSAELLKYLSNGSVTLTVTLDLGTVDACTAESLSHQTTFSSTVHMCVDVSGKVSKSL